MERRYGLKETDAPRLRRRGLLDALEGRLTSDFVERSGRIMDWPVAHARVLRALYREAPGRDGDEADWSAPNVRSILAEAGEPPRQADMLREEVYGGPLPASLDRRTLTLGRAPNGVFDVRRARGGRMVACPTAVGTETMRRALTLVAFLCCARRFPNTPVAACSVEPPERPPFHGGPAPLAEALEPTSPFSPEIPWIRPRRNGSVEIHLSETAAAALARDMEIWRNRRAGRSGDLPDGRGQSAAPAGPAGGREEDL